MAGYSTYLRKKLLEHVWGRSLYDPPKILWLALLTAEPKDDDTNAKISEADYSGYQRVRFENSRVNWTEVLDGDKVKNRLGHFFVEARGGQPLVTHYALFDAEEGGNMLVFGRMSVP